MGWGGASELVACLGAWASEWASEVVGGFKQFRASSEASTVCSGRFLVAIPYLRCFSDLFPGKFAKGQPDSRISRFKEREGQFDTVV